MPKKTTEITGDSIYYYVSCKKITIDSGERGYSGSPVFIKDLKSNRWRIMGLVNGALIDAANTKNDAIGIQKIEYVIADIYKKSK